MAQRSLLCIDPDTATVAEVRSAFQPHGFRVEGIANSDQAMEWAKSNLPVLVILAVEPRKVGYAICNKLRRIPTLQDVPLILISSEETQATFDQHKKLKVHADGYLFKPLHIPDLLAMVDQLVGLEAAAVDAGSDEEIELADDEIAEVSLDEDGAFVEEGTEITATPTSDSSAVDALRFAQRHHEADDASATPGPLHMLGDLSRPISLEPDVPSPFQDVPVAEPGLPGDVTPYDPAQFDREIQAGFAALEVGGDGVASTREKRVEGNASGSETLNLQMLWDEAELPEKMPWEDPPPAVVAAAPSPGDHASAEPDPPLDAADSAMIFGHPAASLAVSVGAWSEGFAVPASATGTAEVGGEHVDARARAGEQEELSMAGGEVGEPIGEEVDLGADLGGDVPPAPEEVIYDDRQALDLTHKEQRILELAARVESLDTERAHRDARLQELQARIDSLEAERGTLRREVDEQRDRMTQAASQGAFSKERDLLSLREVINKKDKDILDLRDALDAKERQILDHKDKIRENERARRDLEERTLGFERSLFLANEKTAELVQDRDKSIERERGLKARLDDAHEELRKSQDEIEALRKRVTQEVERGRTEVDKTRIELEGKLIEARENHHAELSKATDEWSASQLAQQVAYQAELARGEAAHRVEVDTLQRRLADESAAAADRLQGELSKLRRDHEKTITSMKDEQALQLASERQAYEAQTDAKQRAYRDEIMALRRRHEEELAAAEDRRQRDILEQEQRRVAELEQAENRRRYELQGRDEEHHARVNEIERRHLMEKTETAERSRLDYDQAVGRAVRAEGELIARSQELEQAYRRLAGFEADLDSARMELGDRDLKLSQNRDRIGELEAKLSDYEDQIVRAYQRFRTDEKTGEKIRRALAIALALMDERGGGPSAQPALKSAAVAEEAEKS